MQKTTKYLPYKPKSLLENNKILCIRLEHAYRKFYNFEPSKSKEKCK